MGDISLLEAHLRILVEFDATELTERGSLGSINFGSIKELIQEVVSTANHMLSLPLAKLPDPTLQSVDGQAQSVNTRLQQIREFSLEGIQAAGTTPQQQRDNLQNVARDECNAFLQNLIPILPYLEISNPAFRSVIENAEATMSLLTGQVGSTVQSLSKEVDDKVSSLDKALQVVRDTASQMGVAQHADKFKNEAKSHAKSSRNWLIATIVLVVFTVAFASFILFEFPSAGKMDDALIVQKIIARLVIVSLLYYSVVWSAKNYRAHRHLSVLNSHRQNALETFQSFVEGASGDAQTKNAVLLEATHCIFSTSNTGYLGAEEENPSTRIIEVLKTISGSSKG